MKDRFKTKTVNRINKKPISSKNSCLYNQFILWYIFNTLTARLFFNSKIVVRKINRNNANAFWSKVFVICITWLFQGRHFSLESPNPIDHRR